MSKPKWQSGKGRKGVDPSIVRSSASSKNLYGTFDSTGSSHPSDPGDSRGPVPERNYKGAWDFVGRRSWDTAGNFPLAIIEPTHPSVARMRAGISRINTRGSYIDEVGKRKTQYQMGVGTALTVYDPAFAAKQLAPKGSALPTGDAWKRYGLEHGWTPNVGGITESTDILKTTNQTYDEAPISPSAGALVTMKTAKDFAEERRHSLVISHINWRRKKNKILQSRKLSDMIAQTQNPEQFRKNKLFEEFGEDADKLLQAELDKRIENARKQIKAMKQRGAYKYKLDEMTPEEREIHERTMEYGGGPEGRQMAYDRIKKERAERYRKAMLSDEEREIEEGVEEFGSEKAYKDVKNHRRREEALKKLPEFFKNSKMSTKNLEMIAKIIGKGGPLGAIGKMGKFGPIGLGAGAAYVYGRVASKFQESRAEAAKDLLSIETEEALYGSVRNKSFYTAATSIGLGTKGLAQRLGKMNMRFGGQGEEMYRLFGAQMAGMSDLERMYFADALGLDAEDVAIASRYHTGVMGAKGRDVTAQELYEMNKKKDLSSRRGVTGWMKNKIQYGWFEGLIKSGFIEGATKELEQRDKAAESKNIQSATEGRTSYYRGAEEAARSADYYLNTGTGEGVIASNTTTTFNIGTIEVRGQNAKSMVEDITTRAGVSMGDRLNILDNMDGVYV